MVWPVQSFTPASNCILPANTAIGGGYRAAGISIKVRGPCSSTHCATLSEYAREAELSFTFNTTMVFLPGDHTLDVNITVANIGRLSMCGESSSGYAARVVCNGEVGLSFKSMVDFKIHSLTFTSCGRRLGSPTLSKYTLLLKSIDYAELVNCSFNENLGTAIVVDSTNITLAEDNEFSHNHCNSCALETSFQPSTVTEWLLYSKQCTYHTDTFCDISKCCLGV